MTPSVKTFAQLRHTGTVIVLMVALSACTAIHGPAAYLPSRDGIQTGEDVTVQANENIYTIAHEHNVSMRELIVLNNLKPPFEVKPGQTLTLPAGGGSSTFSGNMPAPAAAPLAPVEQNPLAPVEPAGVSSQQLAPLSAPTPVPTPPPAAPQSTKAPQSLLVPQAPIQPSPATAAATQAEPITALNHPSQPQKQVATTMAVPATTGAAPGLTAASSTNMIWPVQGPILSAYGSKGVGLSNDGVNIGAPKGAPVVASAAGTVVYAGNEMKGFGNLVLIRHQDNWVTAYAHLDRVLVKKDQLVDQGDMIGTVGKTGNVPTPQLHFETRQGDKAVDPAGVVKGSL